MEKKNDDSQQRVGDNHDATQQRVQKIHPTPHSYTHKRTPTYRYPTRLKNPTRPTRTTRAQVNNLETIKEEPNQKVQKSLRATLQKLKQNRIQKAVYQYDQPLISTPLQELQTELALAVMCEEIGKLLNYKTLLQTKHKDT